MVRSNRNRTKKTTHHQWNANLTIFSKVIILTQMQDDKQTNKEDGT